MKSGVPADKNSPENIIDFYNTRLFADQLKGMFAETIVLVEVATEFFALPVYLRRIGFSLASTALKLSIAEAKIPYHYSGDCLTHMVATAILSLMMMAKQRKTPEYSKE